MKVRQDSAAAYYDKKLINDVLEINNDVYVNNPRGKKFELKWNGLTNPSRGKRKVGRQVAYT